ncbi:UDP-glucose 4-epimerase GalE [uncultured Murdochiella sp.]|uniref:UDP-glucose 4-epimerase GalE n=1 Tax=uncultured Murdochiella sp. TaxID=1586095 RepID=UPI0028063311|nr:UDP-glucose 4-epimerase GalE [uncultured Murdochiella sp.]
MNVLVSGGLGYIGSHTVVELVKRHHDVVVVDNLYNADADVQLRIEKITGKKLTTYIADCADAEAMEKIFSSHKVDCVIHFAGYKAVGESVRKPLMYYHNNLLSTLVLLEAMKKHNVHQMVFSSSATVYSPENTSPFREEMRLAATNPYGWTKLMIERILTDYATADPSFSAILLRYFNPIGAHDSGLLGERPVGIPNNLLPYICQVADGTREKLSVFGDDYATPDGTGVRDYLHVVDLALGHVAALEKMANRPGAHAFNLGTGKGTSVLELVHAFEQASHLTIPYVVTDRRPGDIDTVVADPSKAEKELEWKATHSIEEACASAWHFQQHVKDSL